LLVSGVDVTANQDAISDPETFQLEFDVSTKRWYIRTMQDRYWTLETGGGIQACGDKRYFLLPIMLSSILVMLNRADGPS
jgi:hypothetical protein